MKNNTLPSLFLPTVRIALVALAASALTVSGAWAEADKEVEKIELKAGSEGPLNLVPAETGSAADTWKGLAETYGFEVEFSDDFEDSQVKMDLDVKTVRTALMLLAKSGGHSWKAVDEKTVHVSQAPPGGAELTEDAMGEAEQEAIRQRLRAKLKAKQAAKAAEEGGGGI